MNFTNANITTTQSTVLAIISGAGSNVQFSNTSPNGDGGFFGSIDFVNGIDVLSLEPPDIGGTLDLYFTLGTNEFFGNYGAAVTPVPFEFSPVLGLGVLGSLWAGKRFLKSRKTK